MEARVRVRAGDDVGARRALSQLREEPLDEDHLGILVEAIHLERDTLADLVGALRTTTLALSLRPDHPTLLDVHAGLLAARRRASDSERDLDDAPTSDTRLDAPISDTQLDAPISDTQLDSPISNTPFVLRTPRVPLADLGEAEPSEEDSLAARVEPLVEKLRADPTRDEVVDELVDLLTKLGRGLELLALLSARLDDAPEARRPELVRHQRDVLVRLEREARAAGRDEEASLFAMSLGMLN